MNVVTREKYLLHTKLETARMILAYMCKEKLNQVAEIFVKTCSYLQFERDAIEEGYAPFNFAYQPISDILHDYSELNRKVSQLVQRYGCNLSYPRTMSDLEKLEYLLEFQSGGSSLAQNSTQPANEAADRPVADGGQTLSINPEMLSHLTEGEPGKENGTMSFILLPNCEFPETVATNECTSTAKFAQGVPSAHNFAMPTTSNAPLYADTPATPSAQNATQGSDGTGSMGYYILDDNGNAQPITIEILPQGTDYINAPQTISHANQIVPNGYSTCVPQFVSPYSAPNSQNEPEITSQQQNSTDAPVAFNSNPPAAVTNQCDREAIHSNPLAMAYFHQNVQEQEQINTLHTGGLETTNFAASSGVPEGSNFHTFERGSSGDFAPLNPTHSSSKKNVSQWEPVSVTKVINQQKVVEPFEDIRHTLALQRTNETPSKTVLLPTSEPSRPAPVSTDESSIAFSRRESTRAKNCARKQSVATQNGTPSLASAAVPQSSKQQTMVLAVPDNQPPSNTGNNGASTTTDPGPSAIENWNRIRSVNMSNFDNAVREVFCKDEERRKLEREAQRRERRKIALRTVQLKKMESNENLPYKLASETKSDSHDKLKQTVNKKRQRTVSARGRPSKRKKRSSEDAPSKANDSLEQKAALLEAALTSPKSSNDQQQQQKSDHQTQKGDEIYLKATGYTVQPVSLSITPAKTMPIEKVASETETVAEISSINAPSQTLREAVEQTGENPPAEQPPIILNLSTRSSTVDNQCQQDDPSNLVDPPVEIEKRAGVTVHLAGITIKTPSKPSPAEQPASSPQTEKKIGARVITIGSTSITSTPNNAAPAAIPIASKHLSDIDRSDSSGSFSTCSSDSSDSESHPSFSSSSCSTTMDDDDDNIRQMVINSKRYRTQHRRREHSGGCGKSISSPAKSLRSLSKHVMISNDNSVKNGRANTPPKRKADQETSTCEFNKVSRPLESTKPILPVPHITIISNRSRAKAKHMVQQRQRMQQQQQRSLRPVPLRTIETPTLAKRAKGPAKTPVKAKLQSPVNPMPATPTRTKTPRKQKLIPTKLTSDETFIEPTPTHVRQRLAKERLKASVRNRYATSSVLSSRAKGNPMLTEKPRGVRHVQTRNPATGTADPTAVEKQREKKTPVKVASDTTPSKAGNVVKEDVGEDAIYAVLAQIHGK